ncbi:MAG: hypothetical protein Q9202_005798 [Teloschistes flavicans]
MPSLLKGRPKHSQRVHRYSSGPKLPPQVVSTTSLDCSLVAADLLQHGISAATYQQAMDLLNAIRFLFSFVALVCALPILAVITAFTVGLIILCHLYHCRANLPALFNEYKQILLGNFAASSRRKNKTQAKGKSIRFWADVPGMWPGTNIYKILS